MANYFSKEREFYYLNAIDIEKITADLENNYLGTTVSDLRNFAEAKTWYKMVLNTAGELCADFIAPRAKVVDEQGATLVNGEVVFPTETLENLKVLSQAGLMGGTLPRKYGGLNLPVTINTLLIEMVSQADASLMNLYGLQDIAVTIYKFGTDEQKNKYLPKFCTGEIGGSMALTEPDAGSDLQAVSMQAIERDGVWYLNGVKRFITNGCGHVSLVLARSEPDTKSGRGLSMFLYERDNNMIIRRLEDKLGIHGSPTCELQFNNAKAELVGKRKFGLIKYVMSLMNGARLSVSAQALGIAQAAYEEAVKYANEREQFGKTIVNIPAVYQMLKHMQVEIETSRLLLANTACAVDMMDMYERLSEHGKSVKEELKRATALADFLTPLSKFTITELSNKVAYDSLQIHGGVGYMRDFNVERYARDARITNIYEGTTQLQVIAASSGLMSGIFNFEMEKLNLLNIKELIAEKGLVQELNKNVIDIINILKQKSKETIEYLSNYLVEMASLAYRAYLMLEVAEKNPEKREIFEFFLNDANVKSSYLVNKINMLLKKYDDKIDALKTAFITKR